MGPLLALTFGTLVHDPHLTWRGLRSGALSLVIATALGFLAGLVVAAGGAGAGEGDDAWPSEEMRVRGRGGGLLVGLAIAVPSGDMLAGLTPVC